MRLKIKNLNKAYKCLTSSEISLYIYIAQRSDKNGLFMDLRMRDAILTIGISKQHFYNCLFSLESKQFLQTSKPNNDGFNTLLIDNRFATEDDSSEPYLNLHFNLLTEIEFHKQSLGMKSFLLHALSFSGKHKWYVSNDTLKKYKVSIEEVEQFCSVTYLGLNNQNDKQYNIRLKNRYTSKDRSLFYHHFKSKLQTYLKRVKMPYTSTSLEDSINVLINFRNYPSLLCQGILSSKNKNSLQQKLLTSTVYRLKINIDGV